jgi:hypothetical protein
MPLIDEPMRPNQPLDEVSVYAMAAYLTRSPPRDNSNIPRISKRYYNHGDDAKIPYIFPSHPEWPCPIQFAMITADM